MVSSSCFDLRLKISSLMKSSKKYFTVREYSEIFEISQSTVYFRLNAGQIPGLKIGNSWRIPKIACESVLNDLKEIIDNCQQSKGEK